MRFRDLHPTQGKYAWLWLAMLAIILLAGNARTGLWDQDEAAYAGFGRTMLQTGDWVVPDFTWSKFHRKPPLHFWGIASSQAVFGDNEWATRLPAAVALWLCAWLFWKKGSSIYGKEIGRWAALILGSSGLFQAMGHISLTDGTLLLWQTLAAISLLGVLNGFKGQAWVFWLAIGLGVLTKGPPIIIFAGGMGLLLMLFHPHKKFLFQVRFWIGAPLAVIPILIWGYMAYQRDNGEFVNWLIDWYILRRVSGSVFGQSGPPGYHLLIMLLAFLPWLAVLPFALKQAWRGAKKRKGQLVGILAWLIAGWLPYELVSSKLPTYALAAHPAFALLLAYAYYQWEPRASLGKIIQKHRQKLLAALFVFMLIIWGIVVPMLSPLKDSSLAVKAELQQYAKPGTSILIGQDKAKPPSLPFYLEQDYLLDYEINPDKIKAWKQQHPDGLLLLDQSQAKALRSNTSIVPLDTVVSRNSGKNVMIEYVILR